MNTELLDELSSLPITLVAVSKTHSPESIRTLYALGQRDFGENRPQEMLEKHGALPQDIQWHFIGHLQTNKVRLIAPFVHLIQSIDSWKLLQEVDKQAAKAGRVLDCLLQFHIAREETKFGFDETTVRSMLLDPAYRALAHVRVCGVMGMASFTDDHLQIRAEFEALRHIFDSLQRDFFAADPHFRTCSMGMSGDWRIALEAGSTMVRIGSSIFGDR